MRDDNFRCRYGSAVVPAVDAVNAVARAWPNVADGLIFKAHKSFARYEATGATTAFRRAGQRDARDRPPLVSGAA